MPKKRRSIRSAHLAGGKDQPLFRLAVLVVTILLLYFIWQERELLHRYTNLGYLGIFLVNFISSATVLFPVPGVAAVFIGGAIWNPILVGLVSGIGASLGEVLGYLFGYGGRGLLRSFERQSWVRKVESFFQKRGFVTIFVFSFLPLPAFDIIGIIAGVFNYPIWKFTLATFLGRAIRNITIALSGAKIIP